MKRLIGEGRLNEAENLLFEKIEAQPNPAYLQVAIDFYTSLDNLSDETLNNAGFPRDEIVEGLGDIKKIYEAI